MLEFKKENIIKRYYSIVILDVCMNVYEEMFKDEFNKPFSDLNTTFHKVIDMMKLDKELGTEYGKWYYRIVYHREDNNTDWQTIYKVYKYGGRYRIKVDNEF